MDKQENLTHRVIKGGAYIFLLKLLERLFTFARLIILARLLAPKDFGLMGIALLTLNTVDTLSQTGFQQALIQKKNNITEHLNPAWTLLVFRGFILATIIFLVAPVAATFFKAPDSTLLIRTIAIVFILQGLMNIGVVFFQKELEFNKQFILHLSG
ncbi:MAG: oligosaccharide flippase family protein, partial [Candidatus Sumerlaeia bacterium]|nr:oligosaccharide flippase family protein [Candidatus Sumerlaeia bacterium]